MEKKKSAAEWREIFEAWRGSGKTRSEFCRERNIPVSTFDYWKRNLKDKRGSASGFVHVPLSVKGGGKTANMRIVIDDHYSVELHSGFERSDLIMVLCAIGSVSCL